MGNLPFALILSPTRVLQLCSSVTSSGTERTVADLSHHLRRRGHAVRVQVPGSGWLTERLAEDAVPTIQGPMRKSGYYSTIVQLAREVRLGHIELIHAHLTRANHLAYWVHMLTGVPVVSSVHIANRDVVFRRLARGPNRIVAVSDFVRGLLHGRGVPERYVDTVHNGTDFFDLPPTDPEETMRELGIPGGRRVVGVVGRVHEHKGQGELVRALGLLRREHPDVHALLVGRVEPGRREPLDLAIREAGMDGRVTVTGTRTDIPRMLDAMELSAMPSLMETFGIAAIEASARGRAVVATRVGALPEVIRDGQTGLLVELTAEAFADGLGQLLDSPGRAKAMGVAGRLLVGEEYSLERMTDRYEAVYARALGRA